MFQFQTLVQAACEDHAEHLWHRAGISGPPPPATLCPLHPPGPALPHSSYLHTGDADAHSPNDPQVLLDEGLQLSDAAALAGEG